MAHTKINMPFACWLPEDDAEHRFDPLKPEFCGCSHWIAGKKSLIGVGGWRSFADPGTVAKSSHKWKSALPVPTLQSSFAAQLQCGSERERKSKRGGGGGLQDRQFWNGVPCAIISLGSEAAGEGNEMKSCKKLPLSDGKTYSVSQTWN